MAPASAPWSPGRAAAWYDGLPWLLGANFTPSTAANQLEMWQEASFDAATIDRELGWAAAIGMNTMRVFLHDLLWDGDAGGFVDRIDAYLAIASAHGIRTLFVLFDDCWHDNATLGPQPPPVPGVHNSRWLQSPGARVIDRPETWGRLEAYVRGLIGRFATDQRILAWDLYNEVTNGFLVDQALPAEERRAAMAAATRSRAERTPRQLDLFDKTFAWARAALPAQPLTAGVWLPDRQLNARIIAASDVISFHDYGSADDVAQHIASLRKHGRPIICTETIARTRGSEIATHFPLLKRERVGCYMWGLVNGKTQTHVAWTPEPSHAGRWFHDLLHPDGSPYDPSEIEVIRSLTRVP
jgi:hypothetical protein